MNFEKTILSLKEKKYFGQIILALMIVCVTVAIVVPLIVFKLPAFVVCGMAILEGALVALLNKIPVWVHGIVVIAQVILGVVSGNIGLMLFMAALYLVAIVYTYVLTIND